MKTLLHITLAKMRKDFRISLFQSFAVFVSMFAISFFVCFVISLEAFRAANQTFGIEAVGGENILTIESFSSFFKEIVSGISFIAIAIVILSFVSLFIFARRLQVSVLQSVKEKQFLLPKRLFYTEYRSY